MSLAQKNILLILCTVVIFAVPLILMPEAEFSGADNKAGQLVEEMTPDFQPWFEGLWAPPGGSVESLLFSLQAAFGTGIIAFYLGYRRGLKKGKGIENDSN